MRGAGRQGTAISTGHGRAGGGPRGVRQFLHRDSTASRGGRAGLACAAAGHLSIRRFNALLVLVADVWFVRRVAPALGMLEGVFDVMAAFVGLVALIHLLLDLPMRRRRTEFLDSGYDDDNPRQRGLGMGVLLLLAIAPLFIAARGLWRGVLPSLLPGPDILWHEAPGPSAWNLLGFVG